ncbi:MAG: hypothetical protein KGI67_16190, partial [Pseudomonadota bacterium]|nr:hypothetical protein [Pseudomonadota bacterium]
MLLLTLSRFPRPALAGVLLAACLSPAIAQARLANTDGAYAGAWHPMHWYAVGQRVSYGGVIYVSLVPANQHANPGTASRAWAQIGSEVAESDTVTVPASGTAGAAAASSQDLAVLHA